MYTVGSVRLSATKEIQEGYHNRELIEQETMVWYM